MAFGLDTTHFPVPVDARTFLDRVNRWKQALRKSILEHNIERKKGEAANIIDPGLIVDYQKSPMAVEAKAMLLGYSETAPLVITRDTRDTHTLMRNYMIIQLMISNVYQAGCDQHPDQRCGCREDDCEQGSQHDGGTQTINNYKGIL